MNAPVTRGELRIELAVLVDRIGEAIAASEQRVTTRLMAFVREFVAASEGRLMTELGRHAKAIQEDTAKQIGALDDKIGALDDKVGVLDGKVEVLDRKVGVLDRKVEVLDRKVEVL